MMTTKCKPTGPDGSLGERERLAWLVLDRDTGTVVGKITRISNGQPENTDPFQAYAIEAAPYDAPPVPPVRLRQWAQCQDAQDEIGRWHDEQAAAALLEG